MSVPDNKKFDKFLFENDFFEVAIAGGRARPRHTPEIEELVKQAREEAYAEGFTAGQEKGRQEAERISAEHLKGLQNQINTLGQTRNTLAHHLQNQALDTLSLLLKNLLGHAAENYPKALLTNTLQQALQAAAEQTVLTLKLHPSTINYFEKFQTENSHLFNEKTIKLQPDASLSPGDCITEWHAGGVESRHQIVLSQLTKLLSAAQHMPPEITSDLPPPSEETKTPVGAEATEPEPKTEDAAPENS